MRKSVVILAALVSWTAWGQPPDGEVPETTRVVTVCVESKLPIYHSESVASRIFANIGVELNWVRGLRDCPEGAIRMRLSGTTPPQLLPGALAYAKPYEGKEIGIFIDRVMMACSYPPKLCGRILGHVMAHEIAHMVQGMSRHSSDGVMKPKWTPADFATMRVKLLTFDPFDVVLIHHGVDVRAVRGMPAVTQ